MDLLSSKCKIIIESVSLRSRFMPHTTSLSTTHSHTLTHKLPHTCDTSATRLQRGARLSRHGHVGRALLVGSPCGVWVCAVWVGGRAHSAAAPRSAGEQHSARGISCAVLVGLRILRHYAVHARRPVRGLLACASNELPQTSTSWLSRGSRLSATHA